MSRGNISQKKYFKVHRRLASRNQFLDRGETISNMVQLKKHKKKEEKGGPKKKEKRKEEWIYRYTENSPKYLKSSEHEHFFLGTVNLFG